MTFSTTFVDAAGNQTLLTYLRASERANAPCDGTLAPRQLPVVPREVASGFLRQLTEGGIKGFDLFKERGKDNYSLTITGRAKDGLNYSVSRSI
jgi:hypothetical protein